MSVVLNETTQFLTLPAVPDPSAFLMAIWARRNVDSGNLDTLISLDDGSFFQLSCLQITAADTLTGVHQFNESGALKTDAAGTWAWSFFRFAGDVRTLRHVDDGSTAWGSNLVDSPLSALAPTQLTIGARYGGGTAEGLAPLTIAAVKIWSVTVPNDATAFSERLSTAVTATAGLWAAYDFLEGALGIDRSGNGRHLTLVGAPPYSADKPSDLTIAGGGGGGSDTAAVRNYLTQLRACGILP